MRKIYWLLLFILAIIAPYAIYLFYFGDCEMIKKLWLIVQVPGRCL